MDWLSRLFEMMPVRGRLDLRCTYGTPWRVDQGPSEANEIPYHAVLAGSAMLEDPAVGRPLQPRASRRANVAAGARRPDHQWRRHQPADDSDRADRQDRRLQIQPHACKRQCI
jgi:AraC family transcriptional activator of mtrCDE